MCQTHREKRLAILLQLGHGASSSQRKEGQVGNNNTISEVYMVKGNSQIEGQQQG